MRLREGTLSLLYMVRQPRMISQMTLHVNANSHVRSCRPNLVFCVADRMRASGWSGNVIFIDGLLARVVVHFRIGLGVHSSSVPL